MKKTASFLAAFLFMSVCSFSQDTTSMKKKRTAPPTDTSSTKWKDHKGQKKDWNHSDSMRTDKMKPMGTPDSTLNRRKK